MTYEYDDAHETSPPNQQRRGWYTSPDAWDVEEDDYSERGWP